MEIKEKSYLTDAPPSHMPTNTVKLYQPRLLHTCPCRELLCCCSCNKNVCWPSVTVTNTVAVQTCLLVEYCWKMDACWTVSDQSACLLTFCHSIPHYAGVVLLFLLYLLVWCLTISHACWCCASL